MKFCTIASGSKGNMTYLETKEAKIILDAGISLGEAQRRVGGMNLDLSRIDAVVISHEHIDHVKFLVTFLKKTHASLFINKLSFDRLDEASRRRLIGQKVNFIEANKKYVIKDLELMTLKLSHDSASIFGYIFISEAKRLACITDTGFFPLPYIDLLKDVDGLVIESNHDVEMLIESNRPRALKERILSPVGHMSNYICGQILELVLNHRQKVVLLAHISEECNRPEIIEREIIAEMKKTFSGDIEMAGQWEASKLYEI